MGYRLLKTLHVFLVFCLVSALSPVLAAKAEREEVICRYAVPGEIEVAFKSLRSGDAYLPTMTVSIKNISPDRNLYLPQGRPGYSEAFANIWRRLPSQLHFSQINPPPAPPPAPAVASEAPAPIIVPGEPPRIPLNRGRIRPETTLKPGDTWERTIEWSLFVPAELIAQADIEDRYDVDLDLRQIFWRNHNDRIGTDALESDLWRAASAATCLRLKNVKIAWRQ